MAVNRGKKFEDVIKEAFLKVENVSVDRLHDQTTGYAGSSNICDFIVYKKPYEYYIECKSVHGNTLSIHSIPKKNKRGKLQGFYGNISDTQWTGLSDKQTIDGVCAGVICWWIDKDVTMYIPIRVLQEYRHNGKKSVRFDEQDKRLIRIKGKKKRVFFEYYMRDFFREIENRIKEGM